jgi:hypothetical protein
VLQCLQRPRRDPGAVAGDARGDRRAACAYGGERQGPSPPQGEADRQGQVDGEDGPLVWKDLGKRFEDDGISHRAFEARWRSSQDGSDQQMFGAK